MASEIIPGKLFIGSVNEAQDKQFLSKLNIKFILNCAVEAKEYFPDDFEYLSLQLQDYRSQQLEPAFKEAFQFIDQGFKSLRPVFVHCVVKFAIFCFEF
jgi:atypical dual specificity phosphatase